MSRCREVIAKSEMFTAKFYRFENVSHTKYNSCYQKMWKSFLVVFVLVIRESSLSKTKTSTYRKNLNLGKPKSKYQFRGVFRTLSNI